MGEGGPVGRVVVVVLVVVVLVLVVVELVEVVLVEVVVVVGVASTPPDPLQAVRTRAAAAAKRGRRLIGGER